MVGVLFETQQQEDFQFFRNVLENLVDHMFAMYSTSKKFSENNQDSQNSSRNNNSTFSNMEQIQFQGNSQNQSYSDELNDNFLESSGQGNVFASNYTGGSTTYPESNNRNAFTNRGGNWSTMAMNGSVRDLSQNLNRLETAPRRENISFTTPNGPNQNTNTLLSQIVSHTENQPRVIPKSSNKMIEECEDSCEEKNENFNGGPVRLPNFIVEKEKNSAEKKPNSDSRIFSDLKRKCPEESDFAERSEDVGDRAGSKSKKEFFQKKKILTNEHGEKMFEKQKDKATDEQSKIGVKHDPKEVAIKKFDELSLDNENRDPNSKKSNLVQGCAKDKKSAQPHNMVFQRQNKAMSTTSNTLDKKPETKTWTQSKKNPGFEVCVVCLTKDRERGRMNCLACVHKVHESCKDSLINGALCTVCNAHRPQKLRFVPARLK